MVGWYYAIDVLFQLHIFLIQIIFTFSLITFDISVLFICYLYEKCIVSLPGLQHILFFSFKSNCSDLNLFMFYFAGLVNLLAD